MRFFTPAWRDAELSDEEFEAAITRYEQRLAEIRPLLPARLAELVESVSLHDGLIHQETVDDASFTLVVRAGDLQRGYFDVCLQYGGVTRITGAPSASEILEDEVDVDDDGHFEHRFLFAPEGELAVRFQTFEYSVAAVESRESGRAPARS